MHWRQIVQQLAACNNNDGDASWSEMFEKTQDTRLTTSFFITSLDKHFSIIT